jgi:hypothetical protein
MMMLRKNTRPMAASEPVRASVIAGPRFCSRNAKGSTATAASEKRAPVKIKGPRCAIAVF